MARTRSKKAPVEKASVVISEEQMKSVCEICDTNKDGRLSKEELKKVLAKLGVEFPTVRAISVLWHADDNEDGYISKNEFATAAKYVSTLSTV